MDERERAVYPNDPQQRVLKRALEVICGKWRLFIILQLGDQARRYGELRRMIPDISEKVLIQELKALVVLGVLEKTVHSETPPRVEYGLTERGRRVLPLMLEIKQIGEIFLEP